MPGKTFAPLLFALTASTTLAQDHGNAHLPSGVPSDRAQRHADVAQRGQQVMPFSLAATTHIFTRTPSGGVQQVVVKKAEDTRQVQLTRQHLREIREQFLKGDYSGPTRIHGQDMPGLAELKAAAPGQLAIAYQDIDGGAELTYNTANPALVSALHRWFDAQLADHGSDAMAGHAGHASHAGHAGQKSHGGSGDHGSPSHHPGVKKP